MFNYFRSMSLAIRLSFLVVLMIFIGLSFALKLSFNAARDLMTQHVITDMEDHCQRQSEIFSLYLNDFKADVKMLASSPGITGLASGLVANNDEQVQFWKQRLQQRFSLMDSSRYLQVRFITFSENGREFLRVDRKKSGVDFQITPLAALQEKGDRDYVQATRLLKPGEFYVSPINLNQEYGAIVHPIQPTFRIAMPVYVKGQHAAEHKTPFGMVVVNIDATFLFNLLSDISMAQVALVNQDGYFLHYPHAPQQCWGWELDQPDHTFMKLHPEFVDDPAEDGSNFILSDHGDILFMQRIVLNETTGDYVTLVLFARDQNVFAHIGLLQKKMIPITWLTLFVTGFAVYCIVQIMMGSIRTLTKKADLLSWGHTDISFATTREDEIGRMSMAFANLIGQLDSKNQEAHEQRDEVQRLNTSLNEKMVQLAESKEVVSHQKKAFQTLFEKANDAIILVEQGKFVECNEAALKTFGYGSKGEVFRLNPAKLSPEYQPDGRLSTEVAEEVMREAMELGSKHFEWVHIRSTGEEFWTDVVLTRLTFGDREVLHGAARDITVQKKLEEEISKERDAARQANLAKSAFLANMSHELRTPMHGILSYARMGAKRWESVSRDKLQRYFQTIEKSGSNLMSLLNNLLDLAKLDVDKMVYSMAMDDICGWLLQVEKEYEIMAEEKKVRLLHMGEKAPEMAWFDGGKIGQVLRNIISNAIKFTPVGREIRIWCTEVEETGVPCVQVNIADSGIGIPETELEHIFATFIQSSKTNTGAGGTGLGLAISKKIIADHHGRIWAENNDDGGACFSLILPLTEDGFTALNRE